jgi:acetyl esterase/lipase
MTRLHLPALVLLVCTAAASAQDKKPVPRPTPTAAIVAYGDHQRHVIDFWQAKSDTPTPLVLFIHGGGWRGGDKNTLKAESIKTYLDNGISVAAINYRFVDQAVAMKIVPPVKAPLEDAARALQFIRSKSKEWNLDKKRIGATGGSAGGASSLWLLYHDEMADPKSSDPVARESTRLYCAAVVGAQTTLDPYPLREWMPNYKYGAHAFGLKSFPELHEKRADVEKWIKKYSALENVSKDDPPVALFYGGPADIKKGDSPGDPTHSALLGMILMQKLKETGVEGILIYPGHTDPRYKNVEEYFIDRLKK